MKSRKITSILTAACLSLCVLGFASNRFAESRNGDQPRIKPGDAVPFDVNTISRPVVGRVQIRPDRLRSATVHVPAGTKAYLAGRLDDDKPDVLAWYNIRTRRLVAAVEINITNEASATRNGVEINAGANEAGSAPALVTIRSKENVPSLLRPEGAVTLQASNDSRRYEAAPLLSFEGSSHLLSLTQPVANDFLHSKQFEVRLQNSRGDTVFSQNDLTSSGDVPVKVQIGTTKPNAPRRVDVINSGSMDKIVSLKPATANVRWVDTMGNETRTVEVPAGGTVSPGSLVSSIPGRFPLTYGERSIKPSDGGVSRVGDWANGPVVVDETGSATIGGLCDRPIAGANTDYPNAAPTVLPGSSSSPNYPNLPNRPNRSAGSNGSGSSNRPSRFAIGLTGLIGAGAMAVQLTNDRGDKHEEQVSFVPVSSVSLEDQPSIVEITPISTTTALFDAADSPSIPVNTPYACDCEDLAFDVIPEWKGKGRRIPPLGYDEKDLDVTVKPGVFVEGEKGIYYVIIPIPYHTYIKCTAASGERCKGTIEVSHSAKWSSGTVDSEDVLEFRDGKQIRLKKIEVDAPCEGDSAKDYYFFYRATFKSLPIEGVVTLNLNLICAKRELEGKEIKVHVKSNKGGAGKPDRYDPTDTDFNGDGTLNDDPEKFKHPKHAKK